ncbi:hypothetical protein V8C86DRAFT_1074249 [Haematococcus lacustris]
MPHQSPDQALSPVEVSPKYRPQAASGRPTQLLDLPADLLLLLLRVSDARSRQSVFCSAKALASILLTRWPSLQLGVSSSPEDRPALASFLNARVQRLQLRLNIGACSDQQETGVAQRVANAVQSRPVPAVTHLTLDACGYLPDTGLASALAALFPALTSLTLSGCSLTCSSLVDLLRHPLLSAQLSSLDVSGASYSPADLQRGFGSSSQQLVPYSSPFAGARIQHLRASYWDSVHLSPCLAPLSATLTHLTLTHGAPQWDVAPVSTRLLGLLPQLRPLRNLQSLEVGPGSVDLGQEGLEELLQALPSLLSLSLPGYTVCGEQQLDALLAATQLTQLVVHGFTGLATCRVEEACRRRCVTYSGTQWAWLPAVHLLHSFTMPAACS